MNLRFTACWLFLLLCLTGGCAGYRLGAPGPGDKAGRTLRVLPVVNETLEPRLSEFVTTALRRQIQHDGTFRLTTGEDDPADWVLRATVIALERNGVSFNPNDIVRPQDFELILRARVRVTDRTTGQVWLDRTFEGRRLMRIGPDLTSSERQALPLVAEDLARQVVLALAEGDW
jgi:hypothetical protein